MCISRGSRKAKEKVEIFRIRRAFVRDVQVKKAEVLRPKKADTVNEIENRLNDWKEKQRYLDEVGEAPLKDDQKKTAVDQHIACQRHGTLAEERSHEK